MVKITKQNDLKNKFTTSGFKKIVENLNNISIHIDIGSGTGWLLNNCSPYFEKLIGIEPSKAAISIAKIINKDHQNITFINKNMCDAFEDIKISKPVFITTAAVFSHIKNWYVKKFLIKLNDIPNNYVMFLHEPYGLPIYQPFWYIKSKFWWAKNLPDWELSFCEIIDEIYKKGIYGIKVGKKNIINKYKMSFNEKINWNFNILKNIITKIFKKYVIK
jgi:hypothetical protein